MNHPHTTEHQAQHAEELVSWTGRERLRLLWYRPQFFCTDIGCGALTGYTCTGAGTCPADCVGPPAGPLDATLAFSVVSTFPQDRAG
jgi:hypothetical protein